MADSTLATADNMAYLHQRGGRFVTVLPKTHAEDGAFRELVARGLAAALGQDRRGGKPARSFLHQFTSGPNRRRLSAPVVSQYLQGGTGSPGPQRADRAGLEGVGPLAGEAPLAADSLAIDGKTLRRNRNRFSLLCTLLPSPGTVRPARGSIPLLIVSHFHAFCPGETGLPLVALVPRAMQGSIRYSCHTSQGDRSVFVGRKSGWFRTY